MIAGGVAESFSRKRAVYFKGMENRLAKQIFQKLDTLQGVNWPARKSGRPSSLRPPALRIGIIFAEPDGLSFARGALPAPDFLQKKDERRAAAYLT